MQAQIISNDASKTRYEQMCNATYSDKFVENSSGTCQCVSFCNNILRTWYNYSCNIYIYFCDDISVLAYLIARHCLIGLFIHKKC